MEIRDVLRILCPTPLELKREFLTKFAPLQPSTIKQNWRQNIFAVNVSHDYEADDCVLNLVIFAKDYMLRACPISNFGSSPCTIHGLGVIKMVNTKSA